LKLKRECNTPTTVKKSIAMLYRPTFSLKSKMKMAAGREVRDRIIISIFVFGAVAKSQGHGGNAGCFARPYVQKRNKHDTFIVVISIINARDTSWTFSLDLTV
jgi:hypothetical protein